jgi:hypothetical protein
MELWVWDIFWGAGKGIENGEGLVYEEGTEAWVIGNRDLDMDKIC